MRSIESEGDTIDEAIQRALEALELPRERVEVEILANAARGRFGFGGTKARVRATVRPTLVSALREDTPETSGVSQATPTGDQQERARDLLAQLLAHLGVPCTQEVRRETDGTLVLEVRGDGSGLVIGRRGQTLDAIDYLLNRMLGRGEEPAGRVVVDVEGYRRRRQDSLEALARRLASEVKETGRVVTLNPMSPRDRRIVHLALNDDSAVVTRSQGSGFYRKISILPEGRGRHPSPRGAADC